MTELWQKLKSWRRRDALEQELREEIETHLWMRAEDGAGPVDAKKRFGNSPRVLEDARSAWGWPLLETLWQDLRYGSRMLLKSPVFTAVAVLSLAIGVGGNTAIFSLVDRVLIRRLPVEAADRLVIVSASSG